MPVIDARAHRVLDFLTVLGFAIAPSVIGLAGLPAIVAYVLAGVHLTLTLLTQFTPTSGAPVPLRVHAAIELVVGPVLVALPFVLNWDGSARMFYIVFGAVIIAVRALSAYELPRQGHTH